MQLEPSGLRFAEPLTLTTQLALPSGAAPVVVLISDDGVELVLGLTLAVDEASGLTTLTVPLPHFSGFLVDVIGFAEAPADIDAGSIRVGDSFTVSVPLTRLLDFDEEITHGDERLRIAPAVGEDDQWRLDGPGFTVTSGPLTPSDSEFPDDLLGGPGVGQLDPKAVFTCDEPGTFEIYFLSAVSILAIGHIGRQEESLSLDSHVESEITGVCILGAGDTSAAPNLVDAPGAAAFTNGTGSCGPPSPSRSTTSSASRSVAPRLPRHRRTRSASHGRPQHRHHGTPGRRLLGLLRRKRGRRRKLRRPFHPKPGRQMDV